MTQYTVPLDLHETYPKIKKNKKTKNNSKITITPTLQRNAITFHLENY